MARLKREYKQRTPSAPEWKEGRWTRTVPPRGDVQTLYVIDADGLLRVRVWARDTSQAYDAYVAQRYPRGEGGGRVMPPALHEVRIRPAASGELPVPRSRSRARQEEALFDRNAYTRVLDDQGRARASALRNDRPATGRSKGLDAAVAAAPADPALAAALDAPAAALPGGMAFDGQTFDPVLDGVRLRGLLARVYDALRDGQWWTLEELSRRTGGAEASVSARIRDLRKPKFGGFAVEHRRHPERAPESGIWQYRMSRPT